MGSDEAARQLRWVELHDWWTHEFTDAERSRVAAASSSLGLPSFDDVTFDASDVSTTQTAVGALVGFIYGMKAQSDASILRRIVAKAEELSNAGCGSALDLHFIYSTCIPLRYRWRDADPSALGDTIDLCERQIALAPRAAREFRRGPFGSRTLPQHVGFKQLAIVREKCGDIVGAIAVVEQARAQRWAGDWARRLARLRRKL